MDSVTGIPTLLDRPVSGGGRPAWQAATGEGARPARVRDAADGGRAREEGSDAEVDDRDEAEALLLLLRLPRVGDRTTLRLVEHFGSGRAALVAPSPLFRALAGAAAAESRGDARLRERVRAGLSDADRLAIRIRVRGRPGYPRALMALPDPPAVVFLRGRTELLDRPALAVVGRRKATGYGRRAAEEIAGALAGAGVVTVSGLAFGVDGAAHRGALERGGDTIAVMGCGPDVPYPRSNRRLFERVVKEGLVVSEFLPGEGALPHHFPRRNRLIAALSEAVVVVEAARRSGALITAGHALDLGRPVGAVPGSIYAPTSEGTNLLLADGAHPILGGSDAVELIAPSRRPARASAASGAVNSRPEPPVEGAAAVVWAALTRTWLTVDDVAAESGLPAGEVLGALTTLELDGLVRRRGAVYRRVG